jgi:hypothetical protein
MSNDQFEYLIKVLRAVYRGRTSIALPLVADLGQAERDDWYRLVDILRDLLYDAGVSDGTLLQITSSDLVRVAVERAKLRHAVSTCGDSEYVRLNRPILDLLDRQIESYLRMLPSSIVDEAREMTNAPI